MALTVVSRYAAAASVWLLASCGGTGTSNPGGAFVQNNSISPNNSIRQPAPAASSKQVLYVSDLNNGPGGEGEIIVYPASLRAKNPVAIRTITSGVTRPFGVWVDSIGTLYVINQVNGAPHPSLTEFHPGASTPFRTITDGLVLPETVAVDRSGTVYINDSWNEGQIEVYAAGSVHPQRIISIGGTEGAAGMSVDKDGNLLAAYQLPQERLTIYKIAPGSSQAIPLNIDLTGLAGPGIGTDSTGNLYVNSQKSATVAVFPPGQREPSRTMTGVDAYGLLTLNRAGALYVASGSSRVSEIAPGGSMIVNFIDGPQSSLLHGVAVSP